MSDSPLHGQMPERESVETLVSPADAADSGEVVEKRGNATVFTQNALLSVGRLVISMAVGFILPSFLVHRLPVATYSAWVLILQMSAYVNYLDFGLQTGISKYVAEYNVKKDPFGLNMRASAGLALLLIVSAVGVLLSVLMAWEAPHLFREMPPALYRDVRLGLLFVGVSTSFNLVCNIFASIFTGLQRYAVPTVLALINRILYVAVVLSAVSFHSTLAMMGFLVAVVNISTGLLHIVAWRRFAGHVRLNLRRLDFGVLREMLAFCSTLAVFTVAMLCISGLDVTIVGRYDFRQTGFYSIAATPTNLMIGIMSAALAPLLPAASAMSVDKTSTQMGAILAKATRYSVALLILSGLPLLVGGYWILRLWVGAAYASQIEGYLRILVLANIVRNSFAPYANMIVATNSQKIGIASASAEAVVNLSVSVYLARHIGALGVAYGKLLGAFVVVGLHIGLSMHYTYSKLSITRMRLFLSGILRPLLIAVPAAILVRSWWRDGPPSLSGPVWAAWLLSTLLLLWFGSMDAVERHQFIAFAARRVSYTR